MTEGGFFQPRRMSPTGLGIVVALHASALAALALMKGPEIVNAVTRTDIYDVPIPPPPDPEPMTQPPRQQPAQQPRSIVDSTPTPLPPRDDTFVVAERPLPPGPVLAEAAGEGTLPPVRTQPPVLAPVRVEAEFDSRYAGDLQPPYPASEERAEREGLVRVRVTIGADGRVKAVHRLSATNDAFWRVTERHALARWRFRPASLDGRPVEASKVMNVHFRLEG